MFLNLFPYVTQVTFVIVAFPTIFLAEATLFLRETNAHYPKVAIYSYGVHSKTAQLHIGWETLTNHWFFQLVRHTMPIDVIRESDCPFLCKRFFFCQGVQLVWAMFFPMFATLLIPVAAFEVGWQHRSHEQFTTFFDIRNIARIGFKSVQRCLYW